MCIHGHAEPNRTDSRCGFCADRRQEALRSAVIYSGPHGVHYTAEEITTYAEQFLTWTLQPIEAT